VLGTSAGDITATTTEISIQFEEFKYDQLPHEPKKKMDEW
jgi:hypothetical protein